MRNKMIRVRTWRVRVNLSCLRFSTPLHSVFTDSSLLLEMPAGGPAAQGANRNLQTAPAEGKLMYNKYFGFCLK